MCGFWTEINGSAGSGSRNATVGGRNVGGVGKNSPHRLIDHRQTHEEVAMSAVAIAAGTPDVAADRSEADMVRSAARADREAFDELYRRHHQVTWRLAQAVAESGAAADTVAEGFSQALRNVRRQRSLAERPFRPQVLAATYRAGVEATRDDRGRPAGSDAPSAVMAAFRSLPDRWRAALWLADVEHLSADGVAAVLGVSAAVASQLADRGRQGLLTRFSQVGVVRPDHLDEVLRPIAAAPPKGLEAAVAKRWRSAVVVDPGGRLVPVSDWLARRAPRPLMTACGGLLALGMVGLGVLTVASPPATTGPAAAISAPGLNGPAPFNPNGSAPNELFGPGANGTSMLLGGLPLNDNPNASVNPILAGEGSSAALSGAAGSLPAVPGSSGSGGGAAAPGGGSAGGGGSAPAPAGSGGGGSTNPTSPAPSGGSTPVVSTPIATVTTPTTGTGAQVTTPAAPAPTGVTVGTPACPGAEIWNPALNLCVNPPAPASAPAPNPLTSLGNTVNQTVNNVANGLGGLG
jgi:DNA-directed RNA polymerase specialized sigma24 family protein